MEIKNVVVQQGGNDGKEGKGEKRERSEDFGIADQRPAKRRRRHPPGLPFTEEEEAKEAADIEADERKLALEELKTRVIPLSPRNKAYHNALKDLQKFCAVFKIFDIQQMRALMFQLASLNYQFPYIQGIHFDAQNPASVNALSRNEICTLIQAALRRDIIQFQQSEGENKPWMQGIDNWEFELPRAPTIQQLQDQIKAYDERKSKAEEPLPEWLLDRTLRLDENGLVVEGNLMMENPQTLSDGTNLDRSTLNLYWRAENFRGLTPHTEPEEKKLLLNSRFGFYKPQVSGSREEFPRVSSRTYYNFGLKNAIQKWIETNTGYTWNEIVKATRGAGLLPEELKKPYGPLGYFELYLSNPMGRIDIKEGSIIDVDQLVKFSTRTKYISDRTASAPRTLIIYQPVPGRIHHIRYNIGGTILPLFECSEAKRTEYFKTRYDNTSSNQVFKRKQAGKSYVQLSDADKEEFERLSAEVGILWVSLSKSADPNSKIHSELKVSRGSSNPLINLVAYWCLDDIETIRRFWAIPVTESNLNVNDIGLGDFFERYYLTPLNKISFSVRFPPAPSSQQQSSQPFSFSFPSSSSSSSQQQQQQPSSNVFGFGFDYPMMPPQPRARR